MPGVPAGVTRKGGGMSTNSEATRLWDELCDCYAQEKWERLEEVGKQLSALVQKGHAPDILKNGRIGQGFNHALAKAGVEFIMERFRRTGS
jgi:hypothetical protein